MDIYLAKHLYDTQIRKLMDKKVSNKFIIENLDNTDNSNNSGGGSMSSISSCSIIIMIGIFAAYLSWSYTSKHNINSGMKIVYAITAFNCGLCFICGYFLFSKNK